MIVRLLRLAATCLALASAAVPGVLAVAEARAEAEAVRAHAHVEAPGGSDSCPLAHGAHCAACTLLRNGLAVAGVRHCDPARANLPAPAAASDVARADAPGHHPGNPRAPPAV